MRLLVASILLLMLVGTRSSAQSNDFVWVFLNTNPNRPTIPKAEAESLQAGHMANIGRLAKEGELLVAGPFYTGGGIFVFRPTTVDSVKLWVSTDPAVKAGRFALDFYPYRPMVGSICAPGEKYTMTTYHSVRFTGREGGTVDGSKVLAEVIAGVTTTDTLLAAGSFGTSGGFAVFQNAVDSTRFAGLASVRNGAFSAAVKKLYIARGSFCEQ
jgi:uncharacterized protein YciI